MIRKVTYRGKRLTTGEWVYGSLLQQKVSGIHTEMIMFDRGFGVDQVQIMAHTAGQFTGFKDTEAVEIYEDDRILVGVYEAQVIWNEKVGAFCIKFDFEKEVGCLPLGEYIADRSGVKVVGNIHDKKSRR